MAERRRHKKTVLSVKDVTSCYEIYSRKTPNTAFIEITIKVKPLDLKGAHDVADDVENKLNEVYGDSKITVHIEP